MQRVSGERRFLHIGEIIGLRGKRARWHISPVTPIADLSKRSVKFGGMTRRIKLLKTAITTDQRDSARKWTLHPSGQCGAYFLPINVQFLGHLHHSYWRHLWVAMLKSLSP